MSTLSGHYYSSLADRITHYLVTEQFDAFNWPHTNQLLTEQIWSYYIIVRYIEFEPLLYFFALVILRVAIKIVADIKLQKIIFLFL